MSKAAFYKIILSTVVSVGIHVDVLNELCETLFFNREYIWNTSGILLLQIRDCNTKWIIIYHIIGKLCITINM